MASGAKVNGVEQLNATLKGLAAKATGQQLKVAAHAGGLVIEVPAKAKAPVDRGNLRRSIHTESKATGAHSAESRTGTNVDYAIHQEFGTSRQPGTPYLRPAYDENKGKALDEVADVLKELTTP